MFSLLPTKPMPCILSSWLSCLSPKFNVSTTLIWSCCLTSAEVHFIRILSPLNQIWALKHSNCLNAILMDHPPLNKCCKSAIDSLLALLLRSTNGGWAVSHTSHHLFGGTFSLIIKRFQVKKEVWGHLGRPLSVTSTLGWRFLALSMSTHHYKMSCCFGKQLCVNHCVSYLYYKFL